jgi:hypothetical protein
MSQNNGHRWYVVEALQAHNGAGSEQPHYLGIYAKDPKHVLEKFKRARGVKRWSRTLPIMKPLSEEKGSKLEENLLTKKRVTLQLARNTYYHMSADFADFLLKS